MSVILRLKYCRSIQALLDQWFRSQPTYKWHSLDYQIVVPIHIPEVVLK